MIPRVMKPRPAAGYLIRRKKRLPAGGLMMMNLLVPSSEGGAVMLPQFGGARVVLVWRVKPVAAEGHESNHRVGHSAGDGEEGRSGRLHCGDYAPETACYRKLAPARLARVRLADGTRDSEDPAGARAAAAVYGLPVEGVVRCPDACDQQAADNGPKPFGVSDFAFRFLHDAPPSVCHFHRAHGGDPPNRDAGRTHHANSERIIHVVGDWAGVPSGDIFAEDGL